MATMTVNGVVITFEPHEADSMIGAAMRLQEPKRSPPPPPAPVQALPQEPEPATVAPAVSAPTHRPRGRPRKRTGNPAIENAIKALELIMQNGRLSMDAVTAAFGLKSVLSIGGIAASIRNSAVQEDFAATDAYRVETTATGKVWCPTAKTGTVLQSLKTKLADLQRTR